MKRFALAACAAALVAAMAVPSFAADLARRAYKAQPSPYFVAPFSWSGFYVGLNGGYGFGSSNWTNVTGTSGDFDTNGALFGATLGYNMQTGVWVWGLEADADYTWIKGSGCGANCETRDTWLGTARGRIGYAWDRWLPYITGGAAFAGLKLTPFSGGGSETKTKFGWTAGLGIEYAFVGAWSAKLEYLYADFGKTTVSAATAGLDNDVKFSTSVVKAGVNYRF